MGYHKMKTVLEGGEVERQTEAVRVLHFLASELKPPTNLVSEALLSPAFGGHSIAGTEGPAHVKRISLLRTRGSVVESSLWEVSHHPPCFHKSFNEGGIV